MSLTGLGVSRGIAIGRAHLLLRGQPDVVEYCIPEANIEEEVARFEHAITTARSQLREIREQIPAETARDITAFIDTHLLMLDDTLFATTPLQIIRDQGCNAEWALKQQRDDVVRTFEEMGDPYLRTRSDDINHVVNRILRILLEEDTHPPELTRGQLQDQIIIADDLTPADTVLMKNHGVAAFVTEFGGPMSHTAILARSLQIPAVVGTHSARRTIRNGETLIIDGHDGIIISDPDRETLSWYRKRQKADRKRRSELAKLRDAEAVTADGKRINLFANIELPEDMRAVHKMRAGGIGLYRTEFLYMNRNEWPSEKEQLSDYRRVLKSMKDKPVFIRTLDLGADKQINPGDAPQATNPALGLRAIRYCLKEPGLFRPQLRALLRASAYGRLRIMFPMLSNTQELFQVLALVEDCKRELSDQGHKFDPHVPLGAVVEVPAVAVAAHIFARQLDFLTIGTNDLIQYTLATDRTDDEVNYLYDPLHPGLLRLIHGTLKAGRRAGIPVAMCGEMAGDTRLTRLLLGMGLTDFSMQPSALLEIKRIILDSNASKLGRLATRVLRASHHDEINGLVERGNRED